MAESTRPVVIANGDDLTLVPESGARTKVRAIPAQYHALKAISHIPLAVFVMGQGREWNRPMAADYRQQVIVARAELDRYDLTAATLVFQQTIVELSLVMLDRAATGGEVDRAGLQEYARLLGPALEASTAEAARLRIDGLHGRMSLWRAGMTAEEWDRLTVIVCGSRMARRGNTSVQYFSKLLGVAGEGPRLVYAEAIFEEDEALRLLGTHRLDAVVSEAFFQDPDRMTKDLLSIAARQYLESRCPVAG